MFRLRWIPGDARQEVALLESLAPDRIRGEWFRPTEAVLKASREGPPELPPPPATPPAARTRSDPDRPRGTVELLSWAWHQEVAPLAKLVLLTMANSPNSPPRVEKIAAATGIETGEVERLVAALTEEGFIRSDGLLQGPESTS